MFKNIAISGAGMHMITILGALTYFCENQEVHKTVVNAVGSSAGALLCFLLCTGISHKRMKQIIFDGALAFSSKTVDIDRVLNIYKDIGIDNGDIIRNLVQKVLLERFNVSNMSFVEFAKSSGKNLVVCVSNVSHGKAEYWSVDTTPNISIVDALLATTSIPFVFSPVILNETVYCDGSLFEHFPIRYFSLDPLFDTLGLVVDPYDPTTHIQESSVSQTSELNLFSYVLLIIRAIIQNITQESSYDKEKNNVVLKLNLSDRAKHVNTNFDFRLLKFTVTPEDFETLFVDGYEAARNHTSTR